jgi:hypothetical protein
MSGWKEWQIGEVVEASDFQSYVQNQVVQQYPDSAARGSAVPTPIIGMVSYLDSTKSVQAFDGTDWVTVGGGTINEVIAGDGLTGGGSSGSVTLNVDESALEITVSQITDLTATAAELNYTDGVTSNIQTQLNDKADNSDFTGGTAGQVVLSNGSSGLKFETGYLFRQQVQFTSMGSFAKADYPWLKAIRVRVVGGGGGGGSAQNADACGGGGGGGGYAEGFITDIAGLASSVTVTIGTGGAGATTAGATGVDGGTTTFSTISATGGSGGLGTTTTTAGVGGARGVGSGGDININGQNGFTGMPISPRQAGRGGDSEYGRGGVQTGTASTGVGGNGFGAGGSGGVANSATIRAGGAGADGIVILDLFA